MINLHHHLNELIINGDTYPHRVLLRHLKFHWAPTQKVWHKTVTDQDHLNYLIKMLEVNSVSFTADASVNFEMIDEEAMRSIKSAMLEVRSKL